MTFLFRRNKTLSCKYM